MANLMLFVPLVLCLSFVLWNVVCLVRNYRIAQKIGIPIRVLIASGDNPVVSTMTYFFGLGFDSHEPHYCPALLDLPANSLANSGSLYLGLYFPS